MNENSFKADSKTILSTTTKRRTIDLLPQGVGFISDDDNLRKFFDATVNQWFQPDAVKSFGGFIGRRDGIFYEPKNQYYIDEVSKKRSDYQLEASATSIDNNENINFVYTYPDLVNELKAEGAITEDESRLFSQDYYSWSPPVNVDMLVNFSNYYWLLTGPTTNVITDSTNAVLDIIGKKTFSVGGLDFQSGLRVIFQNDDNFEFNGKPFIVEGVGRSIQLIDDSEFEGFGLYDALPYDTEPYDSSDIEVIPEYITISRGSRDRNPWSRNNRWFHKDLIKELNLEDFSIFQARRPIIEYKPNIQLKDYGYWARPDVDFIIQDQGLLDIAGKSSLSVGNDDFFDGARVLFTNDPDPAKNNRIYIVFGITATGKIGFDIETKGLDPSGDPVVGEKVRILSGPEEEQEFYFDGTEWILAQEKKDFNQYPKYNLYDSDGVILNDSGIYPESDFNFSNIFSFKETQGAIPDRFINKPIVFSTFGDIEFDNELQSEEYTFELDFNREPIIGYYYYKEFTDPEQAIFEFNNDWHLSDEPSRQRIIDRFIVRKIITDLGLKEFKRFYDLSINPDPNTPEKNNYQIFLNGAILTEGIDFSISGKELELSLTLSLEDGDVLEAILWSDNIEEVGERGFFEIPTNLEANPNNKDIETVRFNELNQHMTSIIENQAGFSGNSRGPNNYRNTSRELNKGLKILNHESPLLKTMLLTGDEELSFLKSVRFAGREYSRFKRKFFNVAKQLRTTGGFTTAVPFDEWTDAAISRLNAGKNDLFPFFNSAVLSNSSFIPSTPASLGILPVFKPEMFLDETRQTPVMVIRGHDGTIVDAQGTEVDDVLLNYETRVYENILEDFRDSGYRPPVELLRNRPGFFRNTEYSRDEWLTITRPTFDRWAIDNRIPFQENVSYDASDRFSWNYSEIEAFDGSKLPGHWRGIYEYFFDTDRPHTNPWEMLGFSQKPDWWEDEYGPAPYTRSNTILWDDIENGIIRKGKAAGEYDHLKRPGLINILPVGDLGNLLDPVQSKIAKKYPGNVQAQADWNYGDGSPAEYTWKTSSQFQFFLVESLFLLAPCRIIELNWNNANTTIVHDEQLVNKNTLQRNSSENFFVHNEITEEGRQTVYGISQWVSDRLVFLGKNIKRNFGDVVRDLGVNLTYKVGGYTKQNTLRLLNDSFGLIPQENSNITLYKSSPIKQLTYSAVIIERDKRGYKVYGYDSLNQNFSILPSVKTGAKTIVEVLDTRVTKFKVFEDEPQTVPYGTKFSTRQELFNFLIEYQRFLESQGWVFDNYDETVNRVIDFEYHAEQFLTWTLESLENGDTLVISPFGEVSKTNINQGQVDNIQTFIQGSYSVLDREGFGITTEDFEVSRLENQFKVTITDETNTGIHLLRLNVVEFEHILIVDNETKFDDLIYVPLFASRQPRLRIFIQKTEEWTGRGEAFGFVIREDGLIDNFEKTVNDIQDYYSFRNLNEGTLTRDVAKHAIGFQNRDYFDNLLLDNKIKFEFYRGFLREKGTIQPVTKILRSDFITETADFEISEEWAFNIGEYGNLEQKSTFQLDVNIDDFKTNPQAFRFTNNTFDNPEDSIIDITPNDSRWVIKRESNGINQFKFRNFKNETRKDLPDAGYIRTDEPKYNFVKSNELEQLFIDEGENFLDGDLFWQPLNNSGDWDVFRLNSLSKVAEVKKGTNDGDPAIIELESAHDIQNGDLLFITGGTESSPDYEGFHKVVGVPSSTEFELETPVSTEKSFATNKGPLVFVLKSVRFADVAKRDLFVPINGLKEGDLSFVDTATDDRWEVFEWDGSAWISNRKENDKIDINNIFNSFIYDSETNNNVIQLQLFDPYKGFLPARSEKNIDFLLDYDPAKYTDGDEQRFQIDPKQAWGSTQVGQLWLDLRNVRWVDYEQGEVEYRVNNWGKVAPGTKADIYEWTRSPVRPSGWDAYVANFNSTEQNFKPSGTLQFGSEQPYVTVKEFDKDQERLKDFFYFWVKNPDFVNPSSKNRILSARNISDLINNPKLQQVSWIAPVDQNAFALANAEPFINDETRVLLVNFLEKPEESICHKQWLLAREKDSSTPPYSRLWNKLKDSLIGVDGLGNMVPDPNLSVVRRYGNQIRPRQSWFINRLQARLEFILKANKILDKNNIVDENPNFDNRLFESDPLPDSSQWSQKVFDIPERNSLENLISVGTKILVESDQTLNGKWAIYEYQGGTNWDFVEKQLFRVSDFWIFVDFFKEGFSEQTVVNREFDTILDRNNATGFKEGNIVRVLDNGTGRWALYQYSIQNNNATWILVGVEDGTIQFKESIATYNPENTQLDNEANAAVEIIIDTLKDDLLTIRERNEIFFTMVHLVHTEQPVVDWAFKTSYIFGIGNVDILEQDFIFIQDQSDQLVDFIKEAKPYHTKIRGLIERKQVPTDIIDVSIEDSHTISAEIKFDRVDCEPTIPDGTNPKSVDVSTLNAADRIKLFYQPTEGMPAKVYEKLINRCEFGGTILDGKGFYQFGTIIGSGYDNQDYDNPLGYDFDESEIKEFYDIFVNGGSFDNSTPVSIGDSGIVIDGGKFHQPHIDKRPEELVSPRIGDPLDIQVYITPAFEEVVAGYDVEGFDEFSYDFDAADAGLPPGGSPRVRIKRYFGTQSGTTGPFSVGQIPQSRESVFVFVNDILLDEGDDYSIDWTSKNPLITLVNPIFDNDIVKIQSYSSGGSSVRKRIYEQNTNETVYDICENIPSDKFVFVSVDGEIADFTVSGTEVTITNPLPSNSAVLVLFFRDDEITITKTQQETASVNGSETFTIQRPSETDIPVYKTTIVHKNGLRLSPPLMKLYKPEPFETEFKIGTDILSTTAVRVWVGDYELTNGFNEEFVVNYLVDVFVDNAGTNYEVGDEIIVSGVGNDAKAIVSEVGSGGEIKATQVTQSGNGYDTVPTVSITSVNGTGASLTPQINTQTVMLTGFSVAQDDEVIVMYEDSSEYTIDKTNTDQLTINSVSIGDEIKITNFTEDISLGMQTEVFEGNSLGFYNLGEAPYDANHVLVSVNGENKIHLRDFVLKDGDQGFDSEYQGYGLIYDASLDYGVDFKELTQSPSDRVVITYFTSKPQTQSAAFRISKNVFGDYEFNRISDHYSTILTQPLLSSDNEIVVEDSSRLGSPNIDPQIPGTIFINGEKIKFWEIDDSTPGQHVLKRIIRGATGYGINPDLSVGTVVRDASNIQQIPGGYVWKNTPDGFLHDKSTITRFLLESSGRINFGCEF